MRKRLSIAFCTPEFLNLDIFMGKIRDTKANATFLQIVFRLLHLLFTGLLDQQKLHAFDGIQKIIRSTQRATRPLGVFYVYVSFGTRFYFLRTRSGKTGKRSLLKQGSYRILR